MGRKHEPSFRLVLTDSKNATRSGRFKEILGSYDPRKSGNSFNTERVKYWLSQGVDLTNTVHNLLITNKVITADKINLAAKFKKAPEAPETHVAEETKAEEPTVPPEGAIIEPAVEG